MNQNAMDKNARIYVAGHRGLVGSALVRSLQRHGYSYLLVRTSSNLDLRNQQAVHEFFQTERPDYVFLAAAKVGGILANNTYRAEFIYDNLMIETNVIHAAYKAGVKKLLFLGSSCIYPKLAPQPIHESDLLTGPLEETNEPYAIAKIAGIKLCEAYRHQYGCAFVSAMPTNLYGPNDNYDLNSSHVLPALIRKMHEAKLRNDPAVLLWGSGHPRREFMHADDLADACLLVMQRYNEVGPINLGVGEDISIADLARLVQKTVGYPGELVFDTSKPDGTPRKLLDVSRLGSLGFKPSIALEDGIRSVYQDFVSRYERDLTPASS
jgi:GDP-L-fucose synthase